MKPHLHHGLTHKTLQLGDVLRRLESVTGIAPRRCGRGFQARCPAHDDRTPSLSIDHGDDGTVLLHCHAGCSFDEIRAALGECSSLAERERFVSRSETTTLSARCRKRDLALASQVYSTRQACLNAKFHKYGKPSRVWEYVDREGKAVGAVVRWDRADGSKVIRPLVCTKHGWRVGAMDRPGRSTALTTWPARRPARVCWWWKAKNASIW